jgi:tetratricopeptide (TPR) repeat protein
LLALLGRTFDQLFYWRNSVVLFEHALAITEHNALAHADLGVAYYQLKQDQKAYDEFKKALEINPNYHHPPMGLGRDLIGAGKPKEALKLLELVISFRPKDPEVNQLLGMALMRDGRHAEAGARFGEVLAVEPKNVQALINFGLALTASGKVTEAIEYYLQALRMDGDSVDARVNLGIAYKAQGKVPEAMEQYAMVVKQAPEMAEARMNLGLILLEQGRMAEASPHIAKWLALSPENERANFYFAVILLAEQQPGPAIAHMRKAVELRTDWAYAIATLAQVLATHPDPAVRNGAEAVKLAERANELTQGMDAEALDALAAAYAEVARFPEAVKTGEKASERAAATGRSGLAQQIQARLALYRQQKPFRQGG